MTQYRVFHNYHYVHKALKIQPIETIDSKSLDALDDEVCRFKNINPANMLNYLYRTYSHINGHDIEKNNITTIKTYDATEPFFPW